MLDKWWTYFRFLGLTQITDASADGIMNVINLFITQKELDITKLRHFGSDRAATMTGIRNGVTTQLKKLNNFITSTHCVAHRLHLASEEAANETPYFAHYKTIIKGIYSYFSNSYKRMYELKKIKEDMEVSDLTILNVSLQRDVNSSNTAKFLFNAI
ncbi:zinc finger protein 862-like [Rhizophagus irregularis DAOM 181602=DAOM 197198]|nr:zinc finger protein 862-like [Rhizophagus irregularis DAOM 181602=DAOM 197198]